MARANDCDNNGGLEYPVFNPGRLTIARELRGLTKRALAELVSVTPQAITQYEDGVNAPTEDNARRIAQSLGIAVGFLYGDEVERIPANAFSFRSRRAMTKSVERKTKTAGDVSAALISAAFSKRFRLPVPDVPDYSGADPANAADLLRQHWGLGAGPISNMVHLLEAYGIEVYGFNADSRHVDAVSFWRDNTPFVLMNHANGIGEPARSGERARFDLAHELGHLVLHRSVTELDSREVESEASRFAAAFLLPAAQFRLECPLFPTLDELLALKCRWKVSVQAMIFRSRELGLLSDWQYQCRFRELATRWGRTSEPNRMELEESAIQPQIFEALSKKGVYADDFAAGLQLEVSTLEAFTPAARYYRRPQEGVDVRRFLTIEELLDGSAE